MRFISGVTAGVGGGGYSTPVKLSSGKIDLTHKRQGGREGKERRKGKGKSRKESKKKSSRERKEEGKIDMFTGREFNLTGKK